MSRKITTTPIPIDLVTGYLGSGKTTLLENIARNNIDRQILFLVNEITTTMVDEQRIVATGTPLVEGMGGGSIFCVCKAEEFRHLLHDIPSRYDKSPLDGIVLETSGIADPSVMGKIIGWEEYQGRYSLENVICVIDPARFLRMYKGIVPMQNQVRYANVVVINKIDLYPNEVQATESAINSLNPNAKVIKSVKANAPLNIFQRGLTITDGADFARCTDSRYQVVEIIPADDIDTNLSTIGEYQGDIHRAKGFYRKNGEMYCFDYDGLRTYTGNIYYKAAPTLTFVLNSKAKNRVHEWIQSLTVRP